MQKYHQLSKGVLQLLIILALSIQFGYQQSIKPTQNEISCESNQYFDTTELICQECPVNTIPNESKLGCKCDKGFYISGSQNQFIPECSPCEANMGATLDQSRCLPCNETQNAIYSDKYKDCVCTQDYYRVQEAFLNGTYLDAKICTACDSKAFQGPSRRPIYSCAACPIEGQVYSFASAIWECSCSGSYVKARDTCLLSSDTTSISNQYPEANARTISFDFVETKTTESSGTLSQVTVAISDTFSHLYLDAAVGCQKQENPQKCQILANLCVLQLYNERSIVCSFFQKMTSSINEISNSFYNDNGWKLNYPWLYYQRSAGDVLYQSKRVKMRVSFGYENTQIGIINKMTYKLAKFDLEGNFYGFEVLKDQLQICETSTDQIERLMQFGTTIENSCTFDLSRLTSDNSYDHPKNENMFYELFIEDYNGDLIDVPVLIRNFYDKNGQKPNADSQDNENQYRLVRRFFLFDTKSGIEGQGGYEEGKISTVVRYPQSITLRIKLDPNNAEMIYTPLLIINYRERSQTIIEDYALATATFTAEYAMDTSRFWNVTKVLFIVLNGIFGLILFVNMGVWCKTPSLSEDSSARCKYAIVKFFFSAIDLYSNMFFWFLVIFSGYWFIFFKMQERVYVLLPALNTYSQNYKPFDFLFGFVIGAKLLTIIFKIAFEQCSFDIFMIDWERPKLPYTHQGEYKKGVNAWRSLLVANELNEMQLEKLISIEFTLIVYALIMEGFGWRYFSTHDPTFQNKAYQSPENYALKFFITAIVIYVIGMAQYLLKYLIKFRVPLKIEEFTDLCSICNISILLFDNSFHGYYIHGRSPYGQAEVSSEMLRKALEYEESGKAQQRGLSSQDPNLQTFEIYMPKRMLQDYKDHYLKDVNEEILKQKNDNTKRFNSVEVMLTKQEAVPKNLDLELLENQRIYMNMIMQTYIEQVRSEPRKYIQDRSIWQRLFQLPSQIAEKGIPIMFKDKWMSFSNLFLQGLDFDFLMLDVLTITFIDLVARNNTVLHSRLMLGILIAYILDQVLIFMRKYFGRKNLAQHTLSDERFLI